MNTVTDFADIGDAGAPVGSPSWCKAAHVVLCSNKQRTNSEVARLKYGLIEFRKFERWRQLHDKRGHPFTSWEDYLQYPEPYGLGMAPESAKLVIEERNDKRLLGDVLTVEEKDLANLRSVGRPKKNTGNTENVAGNYSGYPEKGTRAEALRRLRKDRPDIHKRVLAGKLTPHAGMIEAGFRKKRERSKQSALICPQCGHEFTKQKRKLT